MVYISDVRPFTSPQQSSKSRIFCGVTVLTNHTVVAQCIVFLIGGYDTTASTLAFASHLLAQNVKQQQNLRHEIQELVEREGELTYSGVMEAKLLDACINGI